jgi:hypothetical protein
VLAIKGNQKTLFEDIQLLVDDPEALLDNKALKGLLEKNW